MKNFTVLYSAPMATIDEWMEKPEDERKGEEARMMQEWNDWVAAHKDTVLNTISLGRNWRVTKDGAVEMRNDLMLSSYVQGESAEAVAELFKDHPHFGIPGAMIDIMEARQM